MLDRLVPDVADSPTAVEDGLPEACDKGGGADGRQRLEDVKDAAVFDVDGG